MIVNTARFGEITIEEKDIIHFNHGIFGFEQLTRYVIIQPDIELPFSFMQSVDEGDLSFIITNPFRFFRNYEFQLSEGVQQELEINDEKQVIVWTMVSVKDHIETATCNLLAPVIINSTNQLAKQVILHGSEYKPKHYLFPTQENDTLNAGSEQDARAVSQEG